MFCAGECDVAVIGGGHAGCEAALAAARLGCSVIMFSISLDAIGNLPCNPSIGGTAKGHLVREVDALGGEMGKAADATLIQSKMLNRGKGPAVHSLRAQIDRAKYHIEMKRRLEEQEGLCIKQFEITDISTDENGAIRGVITQTGLFFAAKSVIVATGTYLKGRVLIGDYSRESGPDGMFPAGSLSDSLRRLGVELRRFKTGTPARIHADSLDYSKMEAEYGDEEIEPFSFETDKIECEQERCWLVYTNENTHKIVMDNLSRSAMYGGYVTEGTVGPRYCPSFEDKVVRFRDKSRHQLFIEPMGRGTKEMYAQGFSTSLPEDVQLMMYRSVAGLENVEIMRSAYAIEYDCCDPLQLYPTLEFKKIPNLYGAGQFNGTSGYEEAAAQGLIAGINAALKIKNKPPFELSRIDGYIGTLIDDLVTKGTNEPYRMMTSRSEYRLLLRQDNADERLTPMGHRIGLISDERYEKFLKKQSMINEEIKRVESVIVPPRTANPVIEQYGSTPIKTGVRLSELMKRPELDYTKLAPADESRPKLSRKIWEEVEIRIKYEGYIDRQIKQAEAFSKLESRRIPDDIDYNSIYGLRIEARQKLDMIRPRSLGQASRISGVSPADMSVLIVWMEKY